ncbi:hypothetical protein NL676_024642 [Syzygium grande]|nr:hypothetical protein NL676_024642 [Syzygium grande]
MIKPVDFLTGSPPHPTPTNSLELPPRATVSNYPHVATRHHHPPSPPPRPPPPPYPPPPLPPFSFIKTTGRFSPPLQVPPSCLPLPISLLLQLDPHCRRHPEREGPKTRAEAAMAIAYSSSIIPAKAFSKTLPAAAAPAVPLRIAAVHSPEPGKNADKAHKLPQLKSSALPPSSSSTAAAAPTAPPPPRPRRRPRWAPGGGASTAGGRRRPCSCRSTRIRRSWSRC